MTCPSCQAENEPSAKACIACGEPLDKGTPVPGTGAVFASRYEILSVLGRGGMGMVYKARDRTLDELVALKVLRPDLARQSELAQRFLSEIKLARRIRHRNVCSIFGDGEEKGLLYICMELVEGIDLKRLIREQGALPPAGAYDVAIQTAEGLQAIHEVGIIHRDLKASNIMRDEKGIVRLMDFGLAKRWQTEDSSGATAAGHVVGSPDYMSPEQARGEKLGFESDVYALGIVVFELFTGQVPFKADTPLTTLLKHLHDPPPLAGPEASRLPLPLVPVLRKALAKEPRERQRSARELADALRSAQAASFDESGVTPLWTPRLTKAASAEATLTSNQPTEDLATAAAPTSPGLGRAATTWRQPLTARRHRSVWLTVPAVAIAGVVGGVVLMQYATLRQPAPARSAALEEATPAQQPPAMSLPPPAAAAAPPATALPLPAPPVFAAPPETTPPRPAPSVPPLGPTARPMAATPSPTVAAPPTLTPTLPPIASPGRPAFADGDVNARTVAAAVRFPARAFSISHEPVGCLVAGQFPLIEAEFATPAEIKRARVYFKSALGPEYYFVEMALTGSRLVGKLPKPKLAASPVTYFIQALTATGVDQTREANAIVLADESDCPRGSRVAVIGPPGAVIVYSAKGSSNKPAFLETKAFVLPIKDALNLAPLTRMLKDEAAGVREGAAKGLAAAAPTANQAVAEQVQELKSRDAAARKHAAEVLGEILPDVETARLALRDALEDRDPIVRRGAAEALGVISSAVPSAFAALDRARTDKEPTVRNAAIEALAKIPK